LLYIYLYVVLQRVKYFFLGQSKLLNGLKEVRFLLLH